jgi:hypothetical protein
MSNDYLDEAPPNQNRPMRDIERKAWAETAFLYLHKSKPQLQEIAASLVGFGDILGSRTLVEIGKDLYCVSVKLSEAKPLLEASSISSTPENRPPEESEETLSLERGISLAQTSEDLKRCADVLRGWHLPKGHPNLRRFSRQLLARADELGIEPQKAQEPSRNPGCDVEESLNPLHSRGDQSASEVFDGYPRIINPPRSAKQQQLDSEKSRKEIFVALVKTGKLGLSENDQGIVSEIATHLLSCRSSKDIEAFRQIIEELTLSSAARQQVADLLEMRAGHIEEALKEVGGEA